MFLLVLECVAELTGNGVVRSVFRHFWPFLCFIGPKKAILQSDARIRDLFVDMFLVEVPYLSISYKVNWRIK